MAGRLTALAAPTAVAAAVLGGAAGWWLGGVLAAGTPANAWVDVLVPVAVLLGAAVAAVLSRRWRATVDDAALAELLAAAPVLAHLVPPADPTDLPTLDPGSRAASDFQHVRVAVERLEPALVAVTGLDAGDHAVWVAANLAISLAGAGRRTLLVDGRIGERDDSPADAPDGPGLRGVLAGTPLDTAVRPGPVPGLQVLPPGRVGPDGRDAVDDAQRVVEHLGGGAGAFDVVVVLAPPWERGEDARRLVGPADLVLVLPQGRVRRRRLREVAARARATGTRLQGLVLLAPPMRPAR